MDMYSVAYPLVPSVTFERLLIRRSRPPALHAGRAPRHPVSAVVRRAVLPDRESMVLAGRILFLTEDEALLRAQLAGEDLSYDPDRRLLDNVSTDEMAPGWASYHYDETLGRYALVGLRGGRVLVDAIQRRRLRGDWSGEPRWVAARRVRPRPTCCQVAGGAARHRDEPRKDLSAKRRPEHRAPQQSTDMGLIPRISSARASLIDRRVHARARPD